MTSRKSARHIVALAALALAMIIGHGVLLYRGASHSPAPLAALGIGMVALALLKHVGALGALLAIVKRRFRRQSAPAPSIKTH